MKILVTGASGFVGRSLCAALAARGHQVSAVSLREDAALPLAGAGCLVHLAAIAHRRGAAEREIERVNVVLAEGTGRAAAASGVPMIFMSSLKVHGEESLREPLRETSALAPADPYARSKARAEQALRAIAGLRLTVLRPPLVYGPHVKANFLALMRVLARGVPLPFADLENRRSFVYVRNLADAVLHCAGEPRAAGRTFLVSDGAPLSTAQLCRQLGAALGRPARLFALPRAALELVPGMRRLTRSLELDDALIRRELGWHPPFSVAEGLQATAGWYRGQ